MTEEIDSILDYWFGELNEAGFPAGGPPPALVYQERGHRPGDPRALR